MVNRGLHLLEVGAIVHIDFFIKDLHKKQIYPNFSKLLILCQGYKDYH